TDISALFTRRAQQKFADYDFVKYSELDLEKEAQSQGFQAQSYDLIVAANVIHATRHIGRTLDNLRPLLKPGGRLLMREITQPMRLFDFVFGPLVLPLQDLDAREGELFLT
ncbi:class I SAM-dependent methyltransferase, partial [Escherichia coli]|nr:class I SAM-dependent methyltransferase [Escherichia coli]